MARRARCTEVRHGAALVRRDPLRALRPPRSQKAPSAFQVSSPSRSRSMGRGRRHLTPHVEKAQPLQPAYGLKWPPLAPLPALDFLLRLPCLCFPPRLCSPPSTPGSTARWRTPAPTRSRVAGRAGGGQVLPRGRVAGRAGGGRGGAGHRAAAPAPHAGGRRRVVIGTLTLTLTLT